MFIFRLWFINVPGDDWFVEEDAVGNVSQPTAKSTDQNSSVAAANSSRIRHRLLSKSTSMPLPSTLPRDRRRYASDSETNSSVPGQVRFSENCGVVAAPPDTATVRSQFQFTSPKEKMPSSPAEIRVEAVGADHISSAVRDVTQLEARPDFSRSVSEPAGHSMLEASERRRKTSLRRQSSGLELTIPAGILIGDISTKRPAIVKRQGSDEPDGRVRNATSVAAVRQFSRESSAALIAKRRRQSVVSSVLLQQSASGVKSDLIAGPQVSVHRPVKKDRPLRRLNTRSFSVDEEPVSDPSKPYIPKVAIARRKFLVRCCVMLSTDLLL